MTCFARLPSTKTSATGMCQVWDWAFDEIELQALANNLPSVLGVTDFSFMFAETLYNQDLSSWNTMSAADVNHMFVSSSFNSDISGWNGMQRVRWIWIIDNFGKNIYRIAPIKTVTFFTEITLFLVAALEQLFTLVWNWCCWRFVHLAPLLLTSACTAGSC